MASDNASLDMQLYDKAILQTQLARAEYMLGLIRGIILDLDRGGQIRKLSELQVVLELEIEELQRLIRDAPDEASSTPSGDNRADVLK